MPDALDGEPGAGLAVELCGVTRRFRKVAGDDPRTAVDALTFAAVPGQTVALWGPPGSGKSVVLDMMAGRVRPDAGQIKIAGVRVDALGRHAARKHRASVGLVSPRSTLSAALTALDNVMLPLLATRIDDRVGRARRALDAAGLAAEADMRVFRLGAGPRRRVALARVLVTGPRLVLADEPTADLSPTNAADLLNVLMRYVRQHAATLVLATRDETVAARCRQVIELREGTVVGDHLTGTDPAATRRWIELPGPSMCPT